MDLRKIVEYESRVDEWISEYLSTRPDLQKHPRAHQLIKLAIATHAPGLDQNVRIHLITGASVEILRGMFPDVGLYYERAAEAQGDETIH